jgi:peroxiredoxin
MKDSNAAPPDLLNLPVPSDDGNARHLTGVKVPSIPLPATDGTKVDLAALTGCLVIYAYPRTGKPGVENLLGWDRIPGAVGCTPQCRSFASHFAELRGLGVDHLFGLSTQDTPWQQETAERLELPFLLLSDEHLLLAGAMGLPTFEVEGTRFLKRLTMIIRDGIVDKVFYPVFPPYRSASDVVEWLMAQEKQ